MACLDQKQSFAVDIWRVMGLSNDLHLGYTKNNLHDGFIRVRPSVDALVTQDHKP